MAAQTNLAGWIKMMTFMEVPKVSDNLSKLKELTYALNKRDAEIDRLRERYLTLLDLLPEGVIVVDDNGFIKFSNNFAATLFGFEHKERLVDKNINNYIDNFDIDAFKEFISNIDGKFAVKDFERFHAIKSTGQKMITMIGGNYIVWDDEEMHLQLIIRDITQFVDLRGENAAIKYKMGIVNQLHIELNEEISIAKGWTVSKIEESDNDDKFMCVAKKNKPLPLHTHFQHEKIEVIYGKLELIVKEDIIILGEGEQYSIPSMIPHSARALTDTSMILTFTPPLSS